MTAASAHSDTQSKARPQRLSDADALAMYRELSIHDLGRLGFERVVALHPEPYRTYVVDRNINYSNVCTAKCIFCNFKADPGAEDAYTLSFEQIGRKIEELIEIGGTQILMQGGLVPDADHPTGDGLPFQWYLDLLRFIRTNYPGIHIHAFSPPEIWAFHLVYKMPLRDVLLRLQEAGLATIPGGGGEILVDRVRRKIGQGKTLRGEWLEVMRQAHKLGMKTSCTMMFGHIETVEERIEHLRVLRDLQDETGGFTAFIHWPFQPEGTALGRWKRLPGLNAEVRTLNAEDAAPDADLHSAFSLQRSAFAARNAEVRTLNAENSAPDADLHSAFSIQRSAFAESNAEVRTLSAESSAPGADLHSAFSIQRSAFARPTPDGQHLLLADAHEYLVMLALARLYLDNIPNIQSSWVTMGPKVGQLALFYGANDMGSVMMEENVVSQAGATFRLGEDEIRRLITDAGWTPQQRDQYYRPVTTARRRPSGAGAVVGAAAHPPALVPLTVPEHQ